jgi:hypothetical protein
MKTKEELASLYAKIETKFVIESLKESEPLAEDTLNWELQRAFVFGFEAGRREGIRVGGATIEKEKLKL